MITEKVLTLLFVCVAAVAFGLSLEIAIKQITRIVFHELKKLVKEEKEGG